MSAHAPRLPGYTNERLIGNGGTADVWLVHDAAGTAFAAKVFREASQVAGRREWRALTRHAGEHVVPAHDLLRDETGRSVLVMPFLSGGSLWDVASGRGGLTAGEVVTALGPVAAVLERMHAAGAVHGDLTPRNVLFDDIGKPFVTDLGCSRVPAEPGAQEWGSAGFVAPEILDGQEPTSACDVYSLGATAWFALTGEPVQPAVLRPRLQDILPDLPEQLVGAITASLSMTPQARPTAADVHRAISGAAPAVAVPLDRHPVLDASRDHTASASEMTRRLRDEAQLAQTRQSRRAQQAQRGRGARWSNRRWVVLVAGAAAVPAAAILVPLPGAHTGPSPALPTAVASSRGVAVSAPATGSKPSPSTPATQTATTASQANSNPAPSTQPLPNGADVQALLDCRARAWNELSTTRLGQCLAADSQALGDDTEQLTDAATRGISYRGITFTMKSTPSVTRMGGNVAVRATITRSAFEARSASKVVRQGQQAQDVRLVLSPAGSGWRIASWSLV